MAAGTAHVLVTPSVMTQAVDADLITVKEYGVFDSATCIALVASAVLPTGYHGQRELVLDRCAAGKPVAVRFKVAAEV